MRSDRERLRAPYPSRAKGKSRNDRRSGVSVGFCWAFGFVVCATFGLALFLMFSAGNFSFSPGGGGVEPAWGGNENLTTASLVHVEVTDLDLPSNTSDSVDLYAEDRSSNILEEFGPFPKYLSGYESIILSATDTGTNLPAPEDEEEDDDLVAVVPVSTAPAEPVLTETTPAWREHIVKAGETLSDIAAAYGGITAQDILKANGIKDANRLAEKRLLLIPSDSSHVDDTLDEVRTRQMRIAASTEQLEPIRVKAYVVAPGDSLWSIANAQNIELDTLVGSNTFKTSARLKPGATLRIPNQDGIFYVLKPGETIEAVSKRYGVSMSKIKLVNADRDMAALKPGEEIFLPGAKPEGLIERRDTTRVVEVRKPAPAPAKPAKPAPKVEKPSGSEVAVRRAKGGFRWPVMGRINSPFGWRQHPITRRKDFHTGIDIKAARNDPIKAAGGGKVAYSGWMGGYGKVLVIEHPNGQSTLYAHCSTLLAGKGASVSSGQLVARIGTTGRSTGPHLHFEVRNGNSPVNPIKYLSR